MKKLLLSLLPDKNILSGYIVAALLWGIPHLLALMGVNLDPNQLNALATTAPIFVAHLYDSIVKLETRGG